MQQVQEHARATWEAIRHHLLREYVTVARHDAPETPYVVIEVRRPAGENPIQVFVQPRIIARWARLVSLARVCPADEVTAETVLAHGGAASAGGLVVLDGSLVLRHVSALSTMTAAELHASLDLLAIEATAFQRLFADHRSMVATHAASIMSHWI